MLTYDDLILIRDELQLSVIAYKEFISTCTKHGGTVPTWVQSRFNSFEIALSHVTMLLDSLLEGD